MRVLHNVSMEHNEWLEKLPGSPSITAAARESGIQKTTLMRQLDRGHIPAENVIAIARAYDVNVVDALVATGHLERSETNLVGIAEALGYATNQQLLDEINLRVDPDAVRLFHGDGDVITPNFDATPDVGTHLYAADSSPDELEEGDDGFGGGA